MISIKPLFILGQSGKLFAMYYQPTSGIHVKKTLLHIPAFAEEMNKSRRMVAMQARELAKQGYPVLVFDLFGTGDSEGDFSEATWAMWKQDMNTAYQWLVQQGTEAIALWSLRTGSLLAMDFIADANIKLEHLLCWQPVLNGDVFVIQFLRLRLASAMMDKNAPQEKTSELKQQIISGQVLEVAGYRLNPELMQPLMRLSASKIDLQLLDKISIFELVSSIENTASPVFSKFAEELQGKGKTVAIKAVAGSNFWATQEIVEVPELLYATIASLS